MDFGLVLAGLAVGVVVGLTGMGGGALITPILVFFFGIKPLAAVSSDLVTTAITKPFGGAVHVVRRTVNWRLVAWLALGGVPSGFLGVLVLRGLGTGSGVDAAVVTALGVALLLAAFALVVKGYVTMARRQGHVLEAPDAPGAEGPLVAVRPIPTVVVDVVGGLVVGMTSVGSGSLMIIALMLLYPALQASQLVGTDLVQAVPLITAAAVGRLLFGGAVLGALPHHVPQAGSSAGYWPSSSCHPASHCSACPRRRPWPRSSPASCSGHRPGWPPVAARPHAVGVHRPTPPERQQLTAQ